MGGAAGAVAATAVIRNLLDSRRKRQKINAETQSARRGAETAWLDVVYACPVLQYTAYADATLT
jgi:hypothetical protein